ncbi:hypothetical protein EAF04_009111 [Stromatinia cepivora]|nr:hypothetical protein EAF04_009111 [Stromatinia cepivora]
MGHHRKESSCSTPQHPSNSRSSMTTPESLSKPFLKAMVPVSAKKSYTGSDDYDSYPSAGDTFDEEILHFPTEPNIPEDKEMLQQPQVRTSAKQPLANKPSHGQKSERTYKEFPLQAKPERGHSKKPETHETDESSSYRQPRPTRSRTSHSISHNTASQDASRFEASTAQEASGQDRSSGDNLYGSQLDVKQRAGLKARLEPKDKLKARFEPQRQRAAAIPTTESTNYGTFGVNQFNNYPYHQSGMNGMLNPGMVNSGQIYDGYEPFHAQQQYSGFPPGNARVYSGAGLDYTNFSQARCYYNSNPAGQQMPTQSIPSAHSMVNTDLKDIAPETYGYYQKMLTIQENHSSATDEKTKKEHMANWDTEYWNLKGRDGIVFYEVPPEHPLRRAILLMNLDIDKKMSSWEEACAPRPLE